MLSDSSTCSSESVIFVRSLVCSLFILGLVTVADAQDSPEQGLGLFKKYCVSCHGPEMPDADVNLSLLASEQRFGRDRRIWRRTIEMLETQAMPPEGEQQPTSAERLMMVESIKSSLENVDWTAVRAPGRVPLARMTRAEFQYAAEDLFGVRVNLDRLMPADPEGLSGFANDHTSLVMTPKQLSRYFHAAELISAAAVDQALAVPSIIHYEVEDGTNANWKKPVSKAPDGSRGWAFSSKLGNKYQAVSRAFDFARTGGYRIRMRARSLGPGNSAAAWVAIDSVNDASREVGMLVMGKTFDVYETELFIPKGRHTLIFGYDFYGPLWLPQSPDRAQVKLGQSTFDPPPYDRTGLIPPGVTLEDLKSHGIRILPKHTKNATRLLDTINDGYFVAVLDNLMLHKFHYEKGYLPVFLGGLGYDYQNSVVPAFQELSEITEVNRPVLEKIWESHQPDRYAELKRFAKLQREAWQKQDRARRAHVGDLFVDWMTLEAINSDHGMPRTRNQVRPYLDRLLPLALKGPIKSEDRQRFLTIYERERSMDADHREALQRMLMAVLISPNFLYRTDGPSGPAGVSRLPGYPLAARVSSFLWCSLPDQEVADAVAAGEFSSNEAIDQQVDRMLDHVRSRRFASLFTEQWLNLADIGLSKEPDKELYRYFSYRLANDMREEVALVLDRTIREDRSILDLLDSRDTIINERLARLYDIEGVKGADFRAVDVGGSERGGLLGTAAVLTSTSLATRTSPVRRGQFVLETLLGVELPSPPADVPELTGDAGQSRTESLRESLSRHRSDAKCSGCHNKIDPLGFALEQYDWIGRRRDRGPAGVVDASAQLPDGREISGLKDLKRLLVSERRQQFTTALVRAMLKYALGRDLEYFDEDAVRRIVTEVQNDDFRARTLVKAVVRSYPFRYREIQEEESRE